MSKQEAERLQTKEERRNKGETILSRLWVVSEKQQCRLLPVGHGWLFTALLF